MRFLEPEQIVTVAEAAGLHYAPMVLTAAFIGLRFGELAGPRTDRVNQLSRTIRVQEQLIEVSGRLSFGPPKTRSGIRTVTIPAALADVLAEHFGTAPVLASGLAHPGKKGAPLRRGCFRPVWRRPCTCAGFDNSPLHGLVFHELRHTAVALAVREGAASIGD